MTRGFSLVELSIVLVILGLLTGGILAGRSLIHASELRSVSSDLVRYKTSLFAFRDKYLGLPGDLYNATSFWGDQATGTGSCASAATADGTPGTCNGNGDGKISYFNESARSWQQLAFSGLVQGSFSGTDFPLYPGVNLPLSRIANAGFALYWATFSSATSSSGSDPNRLVFGGVGSSTMNGAAITPVDTWNIDTKLDDGVPSTGKIMGNTGDNPDGICKSGTAYSLSNSGIACAFNYSVD